MKQRFQGRHTIKSRHRGGESMSGDPKAYLEILRRLVALSRSPKRGRAPNIKQVRSAASDEVREHKAVPPQKKRPPQGRPR
jgi:hypothetical protein